MITQTELRSLSALVAKEDISTSLKQQQIISEEQWFVRIKDIFCLESELEKLNKIEFQQNNLHRLY